MRKKILALIAIMAVSTTLITGCGKDKVDADATKEAEVAVEEFEAVTETAEPETVVETESTEAVETTETTEEVAVAEPKLKVEIVEKIESEGIVIASVTNVSDETYGFFPNGSVTAKEDPNFEPGETTYVFSYNATSEDEIIAEIEQNLTEKGYGDTVTHMDTFTADQFADAIVLTESFHSDDTGIVSPYSIFHFSDDTFLGETTNDILVDETTHELRFVYEGVNKVIILWYEITF